MRFSTILADHHRRECWVLARMRLLTAQEYRRLGALDDARRQLRAARFWRAAAWHPAGVVRDGVLIPAGGAA